jgi:glyoxylate reductase
MLPDIMDCALYLGEKSLVKPNVYVTHLIPAAGIEMLREGAEVTVNESDEPLSRYGLEEQAACHDGLVTLLTDRIDSDVMSAGSRLKVVSNVAVGYDNIDVKSATDLGVIVTNTPGVLTDTTVDFAWALLMAIARRIVEGDAFLKAGKFKGWGIQMLTGGDIHARTLGIIGIGRIGRGMAKRAAGFDMRILYTDEYRLPSDQERELGVEYADLNTLLSESDFVTLHTPLTPDTKHLISAERLDLMKPTAYLINTSRGPCVNEADLARALRDGKIAGAALDVFENEPIVHPELLGLPNVILTPHIASASIATRTRMATMAAENCIAAVAGQKPPNIVNPEVLDSPSLRISTVQ